MKELTNFFDAFYSRFVLRDLMAKIGPGSITLAAIGIILSGASDVYIASIISMSFWGWIIFIAIAWLIGFSIQGLGEILKIIRYYPRYEDSNKKKKLELNRWYRILNDFRNNATKIDDQQNERLVIIKEACGNGSLSLLLSSYLLIMHYLIKSIVSGENILERFIQSILPILPILGLIPILIISLYYMHIQHINRQYRHMIACLEKYKNQKKKK